MILNKLMRILNGAVTLAAVVFSVSCQSEPLPEALVVGRFNEADYVTLPVTIGQAERPETKTSLLNDAEAAGSGALVLVYRSDTKELDRYFYFTQAQLDAQATTPLKIEAPRATCDFYILGNLNGIHKTSGAVADLSAVFGADLPLNESSLESFTYRLDGGTISSTSYRRETMAEINTYGIPYQHVVKNVNVAAAYGIPGADACKRLFAKVSVTIDHEAFDGGVAANVGYFVNKRLYMRQVNNLLQPFSTESVKASSAADLSTGDYDEGMAATNGNKGTYVFYVPENMQGTVAGVGDPKDKTVTNTVIPEAIRSHGTYVEFTGTLDKAAGGFGGDVTYKFFLGETNTTNFNVQRGKNYAVTLEFTSNGLFNPSWKVNADLTDSRLFCLTADSGYATSIENVSGNLLVVRPSRDGAMYVYMNPEDHMASSNALLGKAVVRPSDFIMNGLTDCSWYADFMTAGTSDAKWLADRGVTVSWNSVTGQLVFTRTDAAKFSAHIGDERTFVLRLLPGETRTATFTLRLSHDITITVADGKSLVNDFYLGQKRTLTASGFAGSDIRYAAVQEQCGSAPSSAKDRNVQWKTTNDATAPFPSCALDAQGAPTFNFSSSLYSSQSFSGSLDVYAWYPNRFQSTHSGWASKDGKIVLFSDDWLNDACEVSIRISEPRYHPFSYESTKANFAWNVGNGRGTTDQNSLSESIIVNIDGTEFTQCDAPLYGTFDGRGAIPLSSFDKTLFDKLLASSFSSNGDETQKSCMKGIAITSEGHLYVKSTLNDGIKMEELPFGSIRYGVSSLAVLGGEFYSLGTCTISANPTTGLFSGSTSFTLYLENRSISAKELYWKNVAHSNLNLLYFSPIYPVSDYGEARSNHFGYEIEIKTLTGKLGDESSITRSGAASTTRSASSGREYGPTPVVTVKTIKGQKLTVVYEYTQETEGVWEGEEFIPTSMCVPYGEQTLTQTVTNKWDHRSFEISTKCIMRFKVDFNALFVFHTNARALTMEVGTPYGCYLLSKYGAKMSKENRRFCLEACDVNLGSLVNWSPIIIRNKDYNDASGVPQIYWMPEDTGALVVGMSNGYTWDYSAYTSSSWIYRYDGLPSFDFGAWTEEDAMRFCWEDYTRHDQVWKAFTIADAYFPVRLGPHIYYVQDIDNGQYYESEYSDGTHNNSENDYAGGYLGAHPDLSWRFSSVASPRYMEYAAYYSDGKIYQFQPVSTFFEIDNLINRYHQRWGRWILFLGDEKW